MTDFSDTVNTMPAVFANAASYIAFHGMDMEDAIAQAASDAVEAGASFKMSDVVKFVIAVMDTAEAAYKPMKVATQEDQIKACSRFCDIAHRMERWVI